MPLPTRTSEAGMLPPMPVLGTLLLGFSVTCTTGTRAWAVAGASPGHRKVTKSRPASGLSSFVGCGLRNSRWNLGAGESCCRLLSGTARRRSGVSVVNSNNNGESRTGSCRVLEVSSFQPPGGRRSETNVFFELLAARPLDTHHRRG